MVFDKNRPIYLTALNTLIFLVALMQYSYAIAADEIPTINVYFYHDKPPLVINKKQQKGAYFQVINYFNSHSKNFHFKGIYIPKKRIDHMLKNKLLDGILLGVSPTWFKDKAEKKFLWTSDILSEQDEFISLANKPVEYRGATSLYKLNLGGVRGFYYHGIQELVSEKKLRRIDTVNEKALLNMLINNRIDVAIISRSTFEYFTNNMNNKALFYISSNPHDKFLRRIMLLNDQHKLHQELQQLIHLMKEDPHWLKGFNNFSLYL